MDFQNPRGTFEKYEIQLEVSVAWSQNLRPIGSLQSNEKAAQNNKAFESVFFLNTIAHAHAESL